MGNWFSLCPPCKYAWAWENLLLWAGSPLRLSAKSTANLQDYLIWLRSIRDYPVTQLVRKYYSTGSIHGRTTFLNSIWQALSRSPQSLRKSPWAVSDPLKPSAPAQTSGVCKRGWGRSVFSASAMLRSGGHFILCSAWERLWEDANGKQPVELCEGSGPTLHHSSWVIFILCYSVKTISRERAVWKGTGCLQEM